MSAVHDWKTFAASFGLADGRQKGGSDWSLLFAAHGRALALPATPPQDLSGLDCFVHNPRKRWWARLALMSNRLRPGLLPRGQLAADQHRELRQILCGPHDRHERGNRDVLAIQFGSRGPLQKVMVLGNARDGTRMMGKFALRASADERIAGEAACLRRLGQFLKLAPHVPAVVETGSTSGGRPYFIMRAVRGNLSRDTFGARHADLLREIAGVECEVASWQESALARTISARLQSLAAYETESVRVLQSGWSAACRALADKSLPFCLSHGDFASWNLLETSQGLVALDWEYSQPHWNPLGDFFHFHLIRSALDGRLANGRINRDLLLAAASRHARQIFSLDHSLAESIAAPLLLVYLVDTVSFYAIASGEFGRQDRVVNSYLGYIARQP